MEDILENKLICRICLKVVDQSKQSYGNIEDDTGTLRDMMFCCIPEMDIYVSMNPILCFPCIQSLVGLYNFKTKCINTETIIRTYMQRNKIDEFGNVNLTSVVRDLIQINKLQRELQQKRAMEAKKNMVVAPSVESNRSVGSFMDHTSDTPCSQLKKSLDRVATSEEIPLKDNNQVSQKLPEENDSCHKNETMLEVDMSEVPPDKKNIDQTSSAHSQLGSLSLQDSRSSRLNSYHSVLIQSLSDQPVKIAENSNKTFEMNILSSGPSIHVSSRVASEITPTSEIVRPNSNSQLACSETLQEVPGRNESSMQNSKSNFKLHRPFFDVPKPTFETTPIVTADISKENIDVPNPNSLSKTNSTSPQNVLNEISLKSNGSPSPSAPNTGDQKEFDIFSSFGQNNGQTENSSEFKNLDSEISQIIDQLGDDLAKEGELFSQVDNKSSQNQQSQGNFQNSSTTYHSQPEQLPEVIQQSKHSLQVKTHHHLSQVMQQPSRPVRSPSDINQFSHMNQSSHTGQNRSLMIQNPQMLQNSSQVQNPHMIQNTHRVHYSHPLGPNPSQMGNNPPLMRPHGSSTFSQMVSNHPSLGPNMGQIGTVQGHMGSNTTHNQLGSNSIQFGSNPAHIGINSSQMGLNRNDTSLNSQYQHHIGQHQSHVGQHPYQMREYPPQTGHPSQRRHPSEISHHSQMGPRHFPQVSSQFLNMSNHLRNSPQMGYVSSNMANALAQMGQVPSEYNQMSPQMRYLRMQLQMRHGSPSMGAPPHQLGHRLPPVDGWVPQIKHWLPPADHDSSQRKFNYGPAQSGQDASQCRPISYHVGYGSTQMNQGPSPYGQYSHHMNQSLPQMNQNNSQFGHPQNEHYLNRGTHYNQVSPSQSPSISEIHQRSLQQTPTPPSRSPLESLPPHSRSGMFSPPNFDGFSSPESYSNGEIKKSNSPLTVSKSPELGMRYGERDHWKMNSFNIRGGNSPVPRIAPQQMNTQVRIPSHPIGMVPSYYSMGSEHVSMPPPQTNVLPKDHLAQRMRLNCGTARPEYSQLDNYHSPSDESIHSLLVDLPPIESPVVPLSVQIKPLGTLNTTQQQVNESQDTSEILSSVKSNSACESTEIGKNSEVQNGSESVEMKEESSDAGSIKCDSSVKEVSDSEVVTISKEDIYRETDEEDNSLQSNSASNNSLQKSSLQDASMESMETEQIVLNHFLHMPLKNSGTETVEPIQIYKCLNCQFITTSADTIIEHQKDCSSGTNLVTDTIPGPIIVIPEGALSLLKPLTSSDTIITASNNSTKSINESDVSAGSSSKYLSPADCAAMFSVSNAGVKEYKCPNCPHVTNRAHALSKHINSMHTKSVWFHCDYCKYRSTDRSSLRRHMKNLHVLKSLGVSVDLTCGQCGYQCSSEHNLRRHLLKHESGVLQCPFCSYSSKDRSNFRKHLFIHNQSEYHCRFCKYTCYSPYQLKIHLKNKHHSRGIDNVDCRSEIPLDLLVDEISSTINRSDRILVGNAME